MFLPRKNGEYIRRVFVNTYFVLRVSYLNKFIDDMGETVNQE